MKVTHRRGAIPDSPFKSMGKLHGKRCSLIEIELEEILKEQPSDEMLGMLLRSHLTRLEKDGQLIINSRHLIDDHLYKWLYCKKTLLQRSIRSHETLFENKTPTPDLCTEKPGAEKWLGCPILRQDGQSR